MRECGEIRRLVGALFVVVMAVRALRRWCIPGYLERLCSGHSCLRLLLGSDDALNHLWDDGTAVYR